LHPGGDLLIAANTELVEAGPRARHRSVVSASGPAPVPARALGRQRLRQLEPSAPAGPRAAARGPRRGRNRSVPAAPRDASGSGSTGRSTVGAGRAPANRLRRTMQASAAPMK
jgi:hypothetical protein